MRTGGANREFLANRRSAQKGENKDKGPAQIKMKKREYKKEELGAREIM